MRRTRPPLLCLSAVAAAAFVGIGWREHLRFNLTGSMPIGLWRIEAVSGAPQRGQVVAVCLPPASARLAVERGYVGAGECADSAAPLIKPVIAVAGDDVTVSPFGIAVNGRMVEGTALLPADTAGRQLVAAKGHRVGSGEVWVASAHNSRSYDSRYFGPVPLANVRGRAVPVLVSP